MEEINGIVGAEKKAIEFFKSRYPTITNLKTWEAQPGKNGGYDFKMKGALNSKIITVEVSISSYGIVNGWKFPPSED